MMTALLWKHPFTAIVSGPTGCGKSNFVTKFIKYSHAVISPAPKKILWCYGVYQDLFDTLQGVEFHDGVPDGETLQSGTLLILDDLMHEADDRVEKIFTKYSHHRHVSIMLLTQNLFFKKTRTIGLNAHYMILFKNPRDATQIAYLARQMFPSKSKFMIEAFKEATSQPYSYFVIDLKPDTEERMRLRSGIFPDEKTTYISINKRHDFKCN